ncbi:unnamed protein product [Chondrus crispus]|uniref:Uncharacterized protein n=1 Tax=Chondrus crispus TaxID=2769 RepID=R7QRM4_CHOCR|nr:unnamed protein product [Chondrus crispus]CDF40398.1 unnamed protein product [Chondrus crispus]|eukprot:XP_005710692.1 unnamed protein product [Chondrus crispus]
MCKETTEPPMKRQRNRDYHAADYPDFTPNVSPKEMFQAGIFGGTYFRDIKIGSKWYRNAWKEFEPHGWFSGLDIAKNIACRDPVLSRNRYKAKCGQSLEQWLEKGWIKTDYDSHGWVHWYCRFFLGRRCEDDVRQISRWKACAGNKGRWKRNLIAKCVKAGKSFDDETVSPTVRQLLLHWGYQLTEPHFNEYKSLLEKGHKTSFIPQHEMRHVVKNKDTGDQTATPQAQDGRKEQNEARQERRRKRARN